MISFREYVESKMNIEMPKGSIPGSWFSEHNLPMIVQCSCCTMTMAAPSAWIDEEGYTYCSCCAEIDKE